MQRGSGRRRAPPSSSAGTAWAILLVVVVAVAVGWFVARNVNVELSRALGAGTRPARPVAEQGAPEVTLTPLDAVAASGGAPVPPIVPSPSPSPSPGAGPNVGDRLRVANTDGQGVVLRFAPRQEAREPRGLLEGARVVLLERTSEWGRVRADNGLEGWIPIRYLVPAD